MSNKQQFEIPCFSSPHTIEFGFNGYKFIVDANKNIIREFLHQLLSRQIPYRLEQFLILTPLGFDVTLEVFVIGNNCFGPDIIRQNETTFRISFDKFYGIVEVLQSL